MIGEPEIDGGWETASGADAAAEALPAGREHERERVRATRRPWLWALAGVVVSSAVWAGVPAVQERFFPDVPRLGYRHSPDLCDDFELKTVTQAAGRAFEGRQSGEGVFLAQDWSYCTVSTPYEDGTMMYGVELLVELHKKGDPAPEFATGPGTEPATRLDTDERQEVPGLGDRAVLDRQYAHDGSRLMVLDGGAVFTLTVQWFPVREAAAVDGKFPSGTIDENAMHAAMIEDMRALMTKLKR
ncbi:hypothetical protein [Streptomyces sp. NBC_01244]|uniref:hypothetical protein n=1 Tax=Streptomyces sp. NBC_01244 TaxID=2903797 RepID=UPI002E10A0DE|nr:hypothetical protein OG247_27430 [Streptomyces sp. NBC_01244]